MRKLTVKRKWSFVECVTRPDLYVQCFKKSKASLRADDMLFENVGKLKNGKEITVDIPDEEIVVLLAVGKMQAALRVPSGENDVALLVKAHYTPAKGNPFSIECI
ncbi:MAG: hypothetical protein HDT28_07330 [Clostridiales bacterium]|nr:hypothetical protein [Clostridiales bacterium]